jgi:hypothetical protein
VDIAERQRFIVERADLGILNSKLATKSHYVKNEMSNKSNHPVWNRAESYPEDMRNWDWRTWAWEFLRRNVDYQKDSGVMSGDRPQTRATKAIAKRYGLVNLICCERNYEHLVSGWWLSEHIWKQQLVTKWGEEDADFKLACGEVALVFDLKQTLASGPTAIDSLLYVARNHLKTARAEFIESLKDYAGPVRVDAPKIRKRDLFTWLRVYDAIEFSGASTLDTAKVLFPDSFVADPITGETEEVRACKRIYTALSRAKSMVKDEYLALPPLDYLQEKSKPVKLPPPASA